MTGLEWDDDCAPDDDTPLDVELDRCSLCHLIRPVRKFGSQWLCKGCYEDMEASREH